MHGKNYFFREYRLFILVGKNFYKCSELLIITYYLIESSHCDDDGVNNFFLSSSPYFDAESHDKVANNEKYKNK